MIWKLLKKKSSTDGNGDENCGGDFDKLPTEVTINLEWKCIYRYKDMCGNVEMSCCLCLLLQAVSSPVHT